MLPVDKMPEAEVTLRLAMALIEKKQIVSHVTTAIDGAQVKTGKTIHFPIVEFLNFHGWHGAEQSNRWQFIYRNPDYNCSIELHSSSGESDLVTELKSGHIL